MRTFGVEYAVLPPIGLWYFRAVSDFSWPAALANNMLLTLVCAGGAYWRSKQLHKGSVGKRRVRKDDYNNLEPMWPALVFLVLLLLAAVQLILAVTHVSYYRNGPLVPDLFDAR